MLQCRLVLDKTRDGNFKEFHDGKEKYDQTRDIAYYFYESCMIWHI